MGKIVVSAWVTLDGFVAGPDDEMDWLIVDEQMMRYEQQRVDGASALLLGRLTHTDFANAWPAVAADANESPANRAYAQRVCKLTRYVISESGDTTPWDGTVRLRGLDHDSIQKIKTDQPGDIIVYGSLRVVDTLIRLGEVDKLHLLTHPTLLGQGKPLFAGRLDLNHLSTETFTSGVVLNRYTFAAHTG